MSGDRANAWGQIDKKEFEKLMSINAFGALKVSKHFQSNISMSEERR